MRALMIHIDDILAALAMIATDPSAGHRRLLDLLTPLIAVAMPPYSSWNAPRDFDTYQLRYQMNWNRQWGAAHVRLHKWIVEQSHKHPANQIEQKAKNVIMRGVRWYHEIATKDDLGNPFIHRSHDDKDRMGLHPKTAAKQKLFAIEANLSNEQRQEALAFAENPADIDIYTGDNRRRGLGVPYAKMDRRDLQPYARTDLQKRVARLAADGLSNRQIADRLGYRDTRPIAQAITLMQKYARVVCLEPINSALLDPRPDPD